MREREVQVSKTSPNGCNPFLTCKCSASGGRDSRSGPDFNTYLPFKKLASGESSVMLATALIFPRLPSDKPISFANTDK